MCVLERKEKIAPKTTVWSWKTIVVNAPKIAMNEQGLREENNTCGTPRTENS